jgi:hypothetical protein
MIAFSLAMKFCAARAGGVGRLASHGPAAHSLLKFSWHASMQVS